MIANESVARELGARFGISGAKGQCLLQREPGDELAQSHGGLPGAADQHHPDQQLQRPPGRHQPVQLRDADPVGSTITRGLMTNLPATLENPAGALALSILNAGYLLDIELSAIQEQGRGEVISNPRIVTSNQKEAVIKQVAKSAT